MKLTEVINCDLLVSVWCVSLCVSLCVCVCVYCRRYDKDGTQRPGRKGISLGMDQWRKFQEAAASVHAAMQQHQHQ